jgi:hypothetical protein
MGVSKKDFKQRTDVIRFLFSKSNITDRVKINWWEEKGCHWNNEESEPR